jgi:hypothetical protein
MEPRKHCRAEIGRTRGEGRSGEQGERETRREMEGGQGEGARGGRQRAGEEGGEERSREEGGRRGVDCADFPRTRSI